MGERERLAPGTVDAVWAAASATGHASEFTRCPPGCTVAEEHRHFAREPGVYFQLRTPTPCCGRKWARLDERFVLDRCAWCRHDGKPLPSAITLIPLVTRFRDAARRRRR